jgi:hypothetical protein
MDIIVGSYVTHKKFGEGKVVEIENDTVWIMFPRYGVKTFSLSNIKKFLEE